MISKGGQDVKKGPLAQSSPACHLSLTRKSLTPGYALKMRLFGRDRDYCALLLSHRWLVTEEEAANRQAAIVGDRKAISTFRIGASCIEQFPYSHRLKPPFPTPYA